LTIFLRRLNNRVNKGRASRRFVYSLVLPRRNQVSCRFSCGKTVLCEMANQCSLTRSWRAGEASMTELIVPEDSGGAGKTEQSSMTAITFIATNFERGFSRIIDRRVISQRTPEMLV
jgi:hypothetical protein